MRCAHQQNQIIVFVYNEGWTIRIS